MCCFALYSVSHWQYLYLMILSSLVEKCEADIFRFLCRVWLHVISPKFYVLYLHHIEMTLPKVDLLGGIFVERIYICHDLSVILS